MRGFLIGLLLIAALFGVGYYMGWFDVSRVGAGGKGGIVVTWDKEKLQHDLLPSAKDKLEQPPDKPGVAAPAGKNIEGAIRTLDTARALVGIQASPGAGKDEVVLQLTPETRIKVDGDNAKTADLKIGDRARAVYVVRDAANVAESLTVTRK